MEIAEIAKHIEKFTADRDWKNDDPNELLVALQVELGELGEHFMWKKKFKKNYTDKEKKILGYELVDILVYLLQIANKVGIEDLGEVYQDKIKKLAKKYPAGKSNGKDWENAHKSYKKSGKNVLYD